MVEDRIGECVVDRIRLRLLGCLLCREVFAPFLMIGDCESLIVADQPFDFEGFALHRAALPATASADEKMRSISVAGIMAVPNPVTALRRPFETWR